MPQDLIEGLLGYIKGPSYFRHFLIGTIGSDSARARLSGASRYIYIIATGYESKGPPMGPLSISMVFSALCLPLLLLLFSQHLYYLLCA